MINSSGGILTSISLDLGDYTRFWGFVSLSLNIAYLFSTSSQGIWKTARVWVMNLNNSGTYSNFSIGWDPNSGKIELFDDDQMIKITSGCCYGPRFYYYRFNSTSVNFLVTEYFYSELILDNRTKRIVSLNPLTNEFDIISYNTSISSFKQSHKWSEDEINNFLLKSNVSTSYNWLIDPNLAPLRLILGSLVFFGVGVLFIVFTRRYFK